MIESLSSWFTPTVLFCVLNLMIGTILITSTLRNTNNNDKKQQQQQLGGEGEDYDHNLTPSLLQRVRSVKYFSFPDPFNSPLTTHYPENSPSLLQRVRSINLSFSAQKPSPFPSLDQPDQDEQVAAHEEEEKEDLQCQVTRSKSTTCVETTYRMKKAAAAEEEVVVVHRQPETVREKNAGNHRGGTKLIGDDEEAVDRKADDFINKFREQLKMQRIDSILRYKEMLNRGVSI